MKVRHGVYKLGDIPSGGGSTEDVHLGSFSYAWLYAKNASSNATVTVEASPQEMGTTPVWYTFGKSVIVPPSSFAVPLPIGVGSDYISPARIRVTCSKELTDIYIEGVRDLS